jgi:negative regulator of replication initiation
LPVPQPQFTAQGSPPQKKRFKFRQMKNIDVSDEVHASLQRLAAEFHRSADEVLAALLEIPHASPEAREPLAGFVLSDEFRTKQSEADKYLALLAWAAERHTAEFGEFVRGQSSGSHYRLLTNAEIAAACAEHQARQIDGTQYWAVMNLDADTRRRFLARVLDFLGYRRPVIEFVCGLLGGGARRRFGFLAY